MWITCSQTHMLPCPHVAYIGEINPTTKEVAQTNTPVVSSLSESHQLVSPVWFWACGSHMLDNGQTGSIQSNTCMYYSEERPTDQSHLLNTKKGQNTRPVVLVWATSLEYSSNDAQPRWLSWWMKCSQSIVWVVFYGVTDQPWAGLSDKSSLIYIPGVFQVTTDPDSTVGYVCMYYSVQSLSDWNNSLSLLYVYTDTG